MKNNPCDKMIIAVVQGDDYQDVIRELNEQGFYATVLESMGGFLKKKSVTLMIGLNHQHLDEAIDILKGYGQRTETLFKPMMNEDFLPTLAPTVPVSVRIGGVVLFVLDVSQFERF